MGGRAQRTGGIIVSEPSALEADRGSSEGPSNRRAHAPIARHLAPRAARRPDRGRPDRRDAAVRRVPSPAQPSSRRSSRSRCPPPSRATKSPPRPPSRAPTAEPSATAEPSPTDRAPSARPPSPPAAPLRRRGVADADRSPRPTEPDQPARPDRPHRSLPGHARVERRPARSSWVGTGRARARRPIAPSSAPSAASRPSSDKRPARGAPGRPERPRRRARRAHRAGRPDRSRPASRGSGPSVRRGLDRQRRRARRCRHRHRRHRRLERSSDLNVGGGYNCSSQRPRPPWRDVRGPRHPRRRHGRRPRQQHRRRRRRPGRPPVGRADPQRRTARACSRGTCAASTGSSPSATRTTPSRPLFEAVNMSVTKWGKDDGDCGEREQRHPARRPSAGSSPAGSPSSSRGQRLAARPRRACRPPTTRSSPCRPWPTPTASPAPLGGNRCYSWGGYDSDDTFANFSNYGGDVDIMAPGKCIWSTLRRRSLRYMSGTSMASPTVAGAVALYKASRPTATPADVKEALQHLGNLQLADAHRPGRQPRQAARRRAGSGRSARSPSASTTPTRVDHRRRRHGLAADRHRPHRRPTSSASASR